MGGFATTVAAAIQRHALAHAVPPHLCVAVVPSRRAGQAVRRACAAAGMGILPRVLTLDDPALLADALGVLLPAPPSAVDGQAALWALQNMLHHLQPAWRMAQASSVWKLAERLGHYGHTLADAAAFNPALEPYAALLTEQGAPASLLHYTQLVQLAAVLPGAAVPFVMAGFRDDAHGVPPGVCAVLNATAGAPAGLVVPLDAGTFYTAAEHRVLLTADQPMHEARLVALAVRDALAAGRTPTVVCASAPLTRAIADVLMLSGIPCDASAGQPLAATAAGSWLAVLLDVLAEPTAQALAALCFHPLTVPVPDWPMFAHALDTLVWRGLRVTTAPLTGWTDWQNMLSGRLTDAGDAAAVAEQGFKVLDGVLAPLFGGAVAVQDWLAALRAALAVLCPAGHAHPAGEAVNELMHGMEELPAQPQRPALFAAWLAHQLNTAVMRAPRNPHAVPLLGPQEARLGDAPDLIFAGVNAEVWPSTPHEEWLDGNARTALGLPPSGTHVVHALADFQHFWNMADHVTASYALRDMGGQDLAPSPVLQALFQNAPAASVIAWTAAGDILRGYDRTLQLPAAADEAVKPDRAAVFSTVPLRPRWSASTLGTLMQCPYRAALGKTLRLDNPDAYTAAPSPADHGNLMHRWLEAFTQNVDGLPGPWAGPLTPATAARAVALLDDIAQALLNQAPTYTRWVLGPRLRALAPALIEAWMADGYGLGLAEKRMAAPVGPVTFTAIADRLADTPDGLLIVDYKSGSAPNRKQVLNGRKPQLAVEAYLGSQKGKVADVQVWHLKGYGRQPLTVTGFCSDKTGLTDILDAAGNGMARYADAFGSGQAHPAVAGPWCATCALTAVCRTAATATGEDDAGEAA